MIKLLHFPRFKREWIKEILFLLYSIWYIVTHDFGGNCNEWVYGPWYGYYNKKGEIKNWALLCFWVVQHCFELPNSIYLCVWLTVKNIFASTFVPSFALNNEICVWWDHISCCLLCFERQKTQKFVKSRKKSKESILHKVIQGIVEQ